MPKNIEEILDQLIAEVSEGRSVEDCLSEYHEYRDELKPLLELFQRIHSMPKPEPDSRRVAAAVREAHAATGATKKARRFSVRNIFVLSPVLVRTVAVVVLVLVATLTTVLLSADSMPGDALYPVKLIAEDIQYFLTFDTEGKARLHLMFADRRTDEFACLVQPGVPIDRELLADMMHETELAIDQIELLSEEEAEQLIAHADMCNDAQRRLLEKAKAQVSEHDRQAVEEAIKICLEQHECIECMQNGGGMDGSQCPCEESPPPVN